MGAPSSQPLPLPSTPVPPTSAWLPEVSVFPHFSHFRQGRCQSLPSEVTRSAAKAQTIPPMRRWGLGTPTAQHTPPPVLEHTAAAFSTLQSTGPLRQIQPNILERSLAPGTCPLRTNGGLEGVRVWKADGQAALASAPVAGWSLWTPILSDLSLPCPAWGGPPRARGRKESTQDRAPGVDFRVCFYLALGGAAPTLRSFLSRGDPAQGAPRRGGRDNGSRRPEVTETGRPRGWGSRRVGGPEAWRHGGGSETGRTRGNERQSQETANEPRLRDCRLPPPSHLAAAVWEAGWLPGGAPSHLIVPSGSPSRPRFRVGPAVRPMARKGEAGVAGRAYRSTPPCCTWGTWAWWRRVWNQRRL